MVEKIKDRIKIILNYEKYKPELFDKIAVLLIRGDGDLRVLTLLIQHIQEHYIFQKESKTFQSFNSKQCGNGKSLSKQMWLCLAKLLEQPTDKKMSDRHR